MSRGSGSRRPTCLIYTYQREFVNLSVYLLTSCFVVYISLARSFARSLVRPLRAGVYAPICLILDVYLRRRLSGTVFVGTVNQRYSMLWARIRLDRRAELESY